jgi:hypothetical protein
MAQSFKTQDGQTVSDEETSPSSPGKEPRSRLGLDRAARRDYSEATITGIVRALITSTASDAEGYAVDKVMAPTGRSARATRSTRRWVRTGERPDKT